MAAYQPTIVLKKIDPLKVVKLYQSGYFKQATLSTNKLTVDAAIVPSISGATLSFRDKNNCVIIIHASNNDAMKSLPGYKPRCFWCMQDLPSDNASHVPIPSSMFVHHDWETKKVFYYFDAVGGGKGGCCCTFECALSYIRHFKQQHNNNKNNESLEVYLKTLYRLCYPDRDTLREAPDFRLLTSNGGSMTIDEFTNTKSIFVQLPNVVASPVTNQFIAQPKITT